MTSLLNSAADLQSPPREFEANVRFRAQMLNSWKAHPAIIPNLLTLSAQSLLWTFDSLFYTKDPRRTPADRPFVLYPYERELVQELDRRLAAGRDLLIEKSRDLGVTWTVLCWLLWHWRFDASFHAIVGSRLEDLIDEKGNLDTHFERLRWLCRHLPTWWLPDKFDLDTHMQLVPFSERAHIPYMRLMRPDSDNTIVGSAVTEDFSRQGRYNCLGIGTLVCTERGLQPIEQLTDERVIHRSGSAEQPAATLRRPPELLYRVVTELGYALVATADHPVWTDGGVFRPVRDLRVGDRVGFSRVPWSVVDRVSWPPVARRKMTYNARLDAMCPSEVSEDVATILGYLVSEGAVSTRSLMQFTQRDPTITEGYVATFERAFGVRPPMRQQHDWRDPLRTWCVADISLSPIREWLAQVGLARVKAAEKSVPWSILQSPEPVVRAFLSALFEGDGSAYVSEPDHQASVSYSSKSERLVRHLQVLLWHVYGLVASVRYDSHLGRSIWSLKLSSIHAQIFHRRIGFVSDRKQAIGLRTQGMTFRPSRATEDSMLLKIRDILPEGSAPSYDVSFDGADHSFLAGGILNHNCAFLDELAACEHAEGAWTATADSAPMRLAVSTPKGLGNKFAQLRRSGTIAVVTVHWSRHPEKAKGLYCESHGTSALGSCAWPGCRLRSPWYDAECSRREAIEVAQELDIDYLGGGNPYFDLTALERQVPEDPLTYGYLVEVDLGVEFRAHADGIWHIWELPPPKLLHTPYPVVLSVIGADVAEGLGADYSVAVVRDAKDRGLKAALRTHLDTDEFAHELIKVGRFYHNARILCERNGPGFAVNADLVKAYGNVYYEQAVDKIGAPVTKRFGWNTTARTKELMLTQLREEIRSGAVALRDKRLIEECKTFVTDEDGKVHADTGYHDDFIVAMAIAGVGIQLMGAQRQPRRPRPAMQLETSNLAG